MTAQTSHTLQFVRGSVQHRGGRGSNPDLRRMNNSGFTIYDDYEEASPSLSRGRRRHGTGGGASNGGAGEMGLRSMKNPFQRSRSTSGGRRSSSHHELGGRDSSRRQDQSLMSEDDGHGFVWPTHFYPAMAANSTSAAAAMTPTSSEPIYSEPLPPLTMQVREAEKKMVLKQSSASPPAFSPHPQSEPGQISNHIYEYLVTRRSDASTQMAHVVNRVAPATLPKPAPQPVDPRADSRSVPGPATRRRGSLSSSSPSSSAASSSSKRDSQDSNSGKNKRGTKRRKCNCI